jgi:ribonuclease III
VAVASPPGPQRLTERLGIKALPERLQREALTHASYLNEGDAGSSSNERLEFLGDALLGMVVADELFKAFPDAEEGELTRMRSEIVRGTTLADAARRFGLGDAIVLGRGEEAAGGRKRDRNLAGVFEAVVGAVYRGHGYRSCRGFIVRALKPDLRRVRERGVEIDPKSALQHRVQAQWHQPPEYATVSEGEGGSPRRFTVEVRVVDKTLGSGSGSSKREAQLQAARAALASLENDPREEA